MKLLVEIHGDDSQLEKLAEEVKHRANVDIEFAGGHGQNRTYHSFLGMTLVEVKK